MFLRKIKDIRIRNNKIAVIRDAEISVSDLEEQISKIQYSPAKGSKDDDAEKAKLPPFIQVFYYLFFSYLRIPSEKEFWDTYLEWIGGINENNEVLIEGIKYQTEGLKNRLNRTYPSLIRDIHFIYLLEQSKKFEEVEYSLEKDYFNGLDIKVTYKKQEVYVSLFIDTDRSRFYKEKKTRRHDYSIVKEIEFSVGFNSLTKKNNIYLLNSSHCEFLEKLINDSK